MQFWGTTVDSKADIVGIQETHLRKSDEWRLSNKRFLPGIFASGPTKKCGVAIFIRRTLPMEVVEIKRDREGRWLFLKCIIGPHKVTLAVIYSPNSKQNEFLLRVLTSLNTFAWGELLILGDLNSVWDPQIDRSGRGGQGTGTMSVKTRALLRELGLRDPWREQHKTQRTYTFHSPVHKTSSRIDYILLGSPLMSLVEEAEIGSAIISDHAPVDIAMDFQGGLPRSGRWTLHPQLLRDQIMRTELRETLVNYFKENDEGTVSSETVWEAGKAVMRGHCISILAHHRRNRLAYKTQVERELREMEANVRAPPSRQQLRQINKLRGELRIMEAERAELSLLRIRKSYYLHGNTPGTVLARQLRGRQERGFVREIIDAHGNTYTREEGKLQTFQDFYETLYSAETPTSIEQADFLAGISLPSLTAQQSEELGAPITLEEVNLAIKTLKVMKAPGPDGFTAFYYKTYGSVLAPQLVKMFNSIRLTGMIPPSMREAVISLIPKPGKDHKQCASYRPIALLNIDNKLYTKILATRLDEVLPQLIAPDQSGFVRARQTHDNIRRVTHLLEKAHKRNIPLLIAALDAEKAFDRVDWGFLKNVLTKVGAGEQFIKMVFANYYHPSARIVLNGRLSAPIKINRGTRQGCPLSPLLFALYIEPLAAAIRAVRGIAGLPFATTEHKLMLYADDVLLTLRDPLNSMVKIQSWLLRFMKVSGFKINQSKSEMIGINLEDSTYQDITKCSQLRKAQGAMKYLGIELTTHLNRLYEANYPRLLSTTKELFCKWSSLPISWIGRIQAIKMTILPRFLYLFCALPICPPRIFFSDIQQACSKFIWGGHPPRIARRILYRSRGEGGWALPKFEAYYHAAQLRILVEWTKRESSKHWVGMDGAVLGQVPWGTIWLPREDRLKNAYISTPTATTLNSWDTVCTRLNFTTFPSPFTPIYMNPNFTPALNPGNFDAWLRGDCLRIGDLFHKGEILPFSDCKFRYGLDESERFHYLQLRHWVMNPTIRAAAERPLLPFERWFRVASVSTGIISQLYNFLTPTHPADQRADVKRWEVLGGCSITDKQVEWIWRDLHKSVRSVQGREAHYKLLMGWYRYPVILHKFKPQVDPHCWRGCTELGDARHIWWDCPHVAPFWESVAGALSLMVGFTVPCEASVLLLGCRTDNEREMTKATRRVLWSCLAAAKTTVAFYWRRPETPPISLWWSRIWAILAHEKLANSQREGIDDFEDVWGDTVRYMSGGEQSMLRPPRQRKLCLLTPED